MSSHALSDRIIWSTPDLRQWLIVNFLEVLKNVSVWSDLDYVVFENGSALNLTLHGAGLKSDGKEIKVLQIL